jgi:hypothetical protein
MSLTLKPGDRVRLRESISFGTVIRVVGGTAGGRPSAVVVRWDGRGEPALIQPEDLSLVRPPPHGWGWYLGPLPFFAR